VPGFLQTLSPTRPSRSNTRVVTALTACLSQSQTCRQQAGGRRQEADPGLLDGIFRMQDQIGSDWQTSEIPS